MATNGASGRDSNGATLASLGTPWNILEPPPYDAQPAHGPGDLSNAAAPGGDGRDGYRDGSDVTCCVFHRAGFSHLPKDVLGICMYV